MIRSLRINFPDALYHVTCRGNEQRPIHQEETGYATFVALSTAASVVRQSGFEAAHAGIREDRRIQSWRDSLKVKSKDVTPCVLWMNLALRPLLSFVMLLQASWVHSEQEMREGVVKEKRGAAVEEERNLKQPIQKLLGDLQKGDKDAVIALKDAFKLSTDKEDKQQIASALLRAGIRDEQHFDFLIQHAKKAIESDIPFPPLSFDEEGKAKYTTAFLAWCQKQGVEPETAVNLFSTFMKDVIYLADSVDPRAFNILIKAIDSDNYSIVITAARGLARLQDKRAIQPLVERFRRLPPEGMELVVPILLYFNSPEAEAGAEELIKDKEKLRQLRKSILEHGFGPFLGFE